MSIGHTMEGMGQDWEAFKTWAASADDMDIAAVYKKIGGNVNKVKVGDMRRFLIGADRGTQLAIQKGLGNAFKAIPGVSTKAARRMAGTGLAKAGSRIVPGLSVAANVADVADLVTGDESFGNKAMDATFMAGGAALGAAGGPLGMSMGASTGKLISDGTQWLFGDKKSPEQRKMEEALRALEGGTY